MVSSVMQILRPDRRTYFLPLVFGFIILPEQATFSHSTVLEAYLSDIGKTFIRTFLYLLQEECSWRSPFVPRWEGLAG